MSAANHLIKQTEWRDYNLILEIAHPMLLTPRDKTIHKYVDDLLSEMPEHESSLNTVINTIFPAKIYSMHGAEGVFERYRLVRDRVKKDPGNSWGTYFLRMTKRIGRDGQEFNPLRDLIAKLHTQLKTHNPKRAVYELNLVDPPMEIPIYAAATDRNRTMGGPCLSHLSFKLKADLTLMLTAFYRSHYYIKRALGNLSGLAWLQHFVASELGIETAELVCISSMGILDADGCGVEKIRSLLANCNRVADGSTNPANAK